MYTNIEYVENYDDFEGLKGFVLTANNGNIIFLPANGYLSEYSDDNNDGKIECNLWSNTVYANESSNDYANSANTLTIGYEYGSIDYGVQEFNRYYGFGIRPVCDRK